MEYERFAYLREYDLKIALRKRFDCPGDIPDEWTDDGRAQKRYEYESTEGGYDSAAD